MISDETTVPTTDATSTTENTEPTPSIDVIQALKDIYQKIDGLSNQLKEALSERDTLLANADACSSVKQDITRLLGKLEPYADFFNGFIDNLGKQFEDINVNGKVESNFFGELVKFTGDYEPTDEQVEKVVSFGQTLSNNAAPAFLPTYGAGKNVARFRADVDTAKLNNNFARPKVSP